VDDAWLDAGRSQEVQTKLPGLASALDADHMQKQLQQWLLGESADLVVERCEPRKAYLERAACTVRYLLDLSDQRNGRSRHAIVTGRLFSASRSCAAFVQDQLVPLAALADDRGETVPHTARIGMFPELNMAVHLFPLDPDLPTLIDATDAERMKGLLQLASWTETADELQVDECRIDVAHYPRRGRCVLRYELQRRGTGSGDPRHQVLYGKVFTPGETPSDHSAVVALRRRLLESDCAWFAVPRSAGFVPELRMALLEGVPGTPRLARLIAARLDPSTAADDEPLRLEQAVDKCAAIAATVHASGTELGLPRSLSDQCESALRALSMLKRVSPRLGALLDEALARIAAEAAMAEPMESCFCHGDYTPAQVLFDGAESALIDFDSTCQAEPALDLGHFAAYLEVAVRKVEMRRKIDGRRLGEKLRNRFVAGYLGAGPPIGDGEGLRRRLQLYEQISLVRIAIHSWYQLKPGRVATALSVLQEHTR
jgi:hypothetical protein